MRVNASKGGPKLRGGDEVGKKRMIKTKQVARDTRLATPALALPDSTRLSCLVPTPTPL